MLDTSIVVDPDTCVGASNMKRKRHLPRRAFLKQSFCALTAGLPIFLSSRTLGQSGHKSPSDRINIGFIGTGGQARFVLLPGFMKLKNAQVTALCDVNSEHLSDAMKIVKKSSQITCRMFDDFRSLLDQT